MHRTLWYFLIGTKEKQRVSMPLFFRERFSTLVRFSFVEICVASFDDVWAFLGG